MTRGDVLMLGGLLLLAGGLGWWIHPGVGMAIAGMVLLALGFLDPRTGGSSGKGEGG